MKTAYPTATDVEDFIEASGITCTAAQTGFLDEAALAGKQLIERRCCRTFKGSGSNSTRYFQPPTSKRGILWLDEDLASLNTVQYQPEGSTAQTLTLNTDFWVRPDNYSARLEPIQALEFRLRWSQPNGMGLRRSILVNGQWGYATAADGFPEAVWLAMIAGGLLQMWEIFAQSLTGGLLSWKEADVQEDYGVEPLKRLRDSWESRVETTVRLYKRAEI